MTDRSEKTPPDEGTEQREDSPFTSPPPPDVKTNLEVISHAFPYSVLDPEAVKVVRRLNRFGYEAYLVGGCVRDLLLGIQPKDFDVVTSAMPAQVRKLFRNCRLIGRRFRLAHLHFRDRKIIEVATFRRTPNESDDLTGKHSAENLFGKPADDAIRRDFTINALMYDVGRKEILDWVGGMSDVEGRTLRSIGDPSRRLPEDPVRIVRAVKFGIRLDLSFDPQLAEAMRRHAYLIKECAPARLVEEMFKLLRSGRSAECISMVHEIGLLDHLMPGLAASVNDLDRPHDAWGPLERADAMLSEGRIMTDPVLLAALLHIAIKDVLAMEGDISKRLDERLGPLVEPLPFTRRHMARVRQILIAQRRLARGPRTRRNRRILDREYAIEAINLLRLTAATPEEKALVDAWGKAVSHRHTGEMPSYQPPRRSRPRRRKPRKEPDGEFQP